MRKVIVNSTPLIALCKVNQLDLLRRIYVEITVPKILAQEHEGEHLVVIDDNAARKTAQFLGLTLTGTMGVLIKAKQLGYIDSVMPIVSRMEENKIFFSTGLKERVKRLSHEECGNPLNESPSTGEIRCWFVI